MINWLIHASEQLNPEQIIVVTSPNMDDVAMTVAPHKIAIQDVPNGTGGAVQAALQYIPNNDQGNTLILYADNPLLKPETLKNIVRTQAQNPDGLTILGAIVNNPTGYGRLVVKDDGFLEKIVEHKDTTDEERAITLINIGAFCLKTDSLKRWITKIDNKNAQSEYYITDLPQIAALGVSQ